MSFLGKTVFVTGSFKGIGKATCYKFAQEKANVVFFGRKSGSTDSQNLGDEISSNVEKFGGSSLILFGDVRCDVDVQKALDDTVAAFNGVDVLVNNAGVISLKPISKTKIEEFDSMIQTNLRPIFLLSKLFFPYLCKSTNPHIINVCPPFNMKTKYFKDQMAYTISKFGASMCSKGMAEEFKENGIAVNGIWPSTVIFTNAIEKIYGQSLKQKCRKPEIMADAILEIACRDSKEFTGNLVTDEDVLTSRPLDEYNYENGDKLLPCLYIENTESMVHSDGRDAVFHRISAFFQKAHAKVSKVNQDLGPILNICVQFKDFDHTWFIDIESARKGCFPGRYTEKSVELTVSAKTLEDIIKRKTDPYTCYLTGNLAYKGEFSEYPRLKEIYKILFK